MSPPSPEEDLSSLRSAMIELHLSGEGLHQPWLLRAFRRVPREAFVPPAWRDLSYEDQPIPLDDGGALPSPRATALVLRALQPRPGQHVLEVGTGSGYQAALAAAAGARVTSLERSPVLAAAARRALQGWSVTVLDGTRWPEGPFDSVLLSGAVPALDPAWGRFVAPGGRLVAPVGSNPQHLLTWFPGRRTRRGPPVHFSALELS